VSGAKEKMVKRMPYRSILVALLLAAGLSVLIVGCFGGGGNTATTRSTADGQRPSLTTLPLEVTAGLTAAEADALSTFRSKDPFIQQALPTTTTTAKPGGSTGTSGVTTTYHPGGSTGTTRPAGTTTTKPSTTTTAPHVHTLKILSVGDVGGSPAVTFQVDSSVYKDKRIGDVVSSSWGQIKVLDLSTSSRVATLLHGSETLVLSAGQLVYE
jgi:hypothetical protein